MNSDDFTSLMDLDEADSEGNVQMTGDNKGSDDEFSYTSQSQSPTPPVSSEPAGAVSPMSSTSCNVVTAFSSSGETEKPKKKTVISAISKAIKISEEEKDLGKKVQSGLLKFFSKGTEEDRAAYFRREDDKAAAIRSQDEAYRKHQDARKKLRERELARERQQKRRKKMKNDDILIGARSPGGTKRKAGS